ncbi:MAG: dihydrofolate reductase family protein [Pseudomonadota bacterium]
MKVILVMAMTADGKIAKNSMEFVDWTGKADKRYFVSTTKKAGVMIMGSRTFDTIGKVLPDRKSIVMTKDKTRISDHADLEFTDQLPHQILNDLQNRGYTCVTLIGGSIVNTLFMEQDLVDEIHLTMVPFFFGAGLSMFNKDLKIQVELLDTQIIEKDCLLLKYRVIHKER